MKSVALRVAAFLCAVLICAVGLVAVTRQTPQEASQLHIVATFYPVYILTRNLTDGIEGVKVDNLIPATTGCLHDYQISPQELVALKSADLLVLCGAGAETFLDPIRERYPSLPWIDSSVGISLLAEEEHEEHEHFNSHIWMSPTRYLHQLDNVRDGLIACDPAHADAYRENAARYAAKIQAAAARLRTAAAHLPPVSAVLFHDSLAYLADEIGLPVLATLSVGEEEGVSAAALSEASDRIRSAEAVLFLYDAQYRDLTYAYLQEETRHAAALFLNTAVSGTDDPDAWCAAMEDIAAALEEVSL